MSNGCSTCDDGMIAINPDLLGFLIAKSGMESLDEFEQWRIAGSPYDSHLVKAQKKKSKRELDFKPKKDLGEGKATPEELQYRQVIILYLEQAYNQIKKAMHSEDTPDSKVLQITKIIDTFIMDTQKVVVATVTQRYYDGYQRMQDSLKKQKVKVKPMDKKQPRLDALILQQKTNIEEIGLFLRGRARQIITMDAFNSYYQPKNGAIKKEATPKQNWSACMIRVHRTNPEMNEQELRRYCEYLYMDEQLDGATQNSQDRLDMLGMFGYLQSDKSGYLQSAIITQEDLIAGVVGIAGVGALASASAQILIPWLTCEDKGDCGTEAPICDDCLFAASNGPYTPEDYPDDMHNGERCSPGEPEVVLT